MEKAWVTLSFDMRAWMDLAEKRGSRSEIILSGMPYLGRKMEMKIHAMSSDVEVFVVGTNIAPFESPWSTMDNIESYSRLSYPLEGGKSVIRSMLTWAKGLVEAADSMGFRGGFKGCWFILNC